MFAAKDYKVREIQLYYIEENIPSIHIHQKALESEGLEWNRNACETDDGNFLRVYTKKEFISSGVYLTETTPLNRIKF